MLPCNQYIICIKLPIINSSLSATKCVPTTKKNSSSADTEPYLRLRQYRRVWYIFLKVLYFTSVFNTDGNRENPWGIWRIPQNVKQCDGLFCMYQKCLSSTYESHGFQYHVTQEQHLLTYRAAEKNIWKDNFVHNSFLCKSFMVVILNIFSSLVVFYPVYYRLWPLLWTSPACTTNIMFFDSRYFYHDLVEPFSF